jgi:penicillin-binding protein 2
VTEPGGTAWASHLEGIDFAGKTGTAQVISKNAGMNKIAANVADRPNAWFVGIAPRRNPDIVVVVLWQHGGWGSGSARMASQVIEAYVDKQRRLHHNLPTQTAAAAQPVEVGALWSNPDHPGALGGKPLAPQPGGPADSSLRAGHFELPIPAAAAQAPSGGSAALTAAKPAPKATLAAKPGSSPDTGLGR